VSLTVWQSVTLRTGEVVLAERRNIDPGVPPFSAPAAIVLAAGARVCLALNYVLAVVLICAGAGIAAAGRALMAEVRGSDG